jgi:hypothetical protein
MITFGKKPIKIDDLDFVQINGGMNKIDGVLTEAYDFLPNYSSLNSVLFESSIILTSWTHRDQLFSSGLVGFIHDDIIKTDYFDECLSIIRSGPPTSSAYGITTPYGVDCSTADVTEDPFFLCDNDPWRFMPFDGLVDIWDIIKQYDPQSYEFANDENNPMAYGHQFICTSDVFQKLGHHLKWVLSRITLSDVGLWIPHVFERIIAIRLFMYASESFRLLNMYTHNLSSGNGPSRLYGTREHKFISF